MKRMNIFKIIIGIVATFFLAFALIVPTSCGGGKSSKSSTTPITGFIGSNNTDSEGNVSNGNTVYVSQYGECFHTIYTCAGKHPAATSLSSAVARGRRPCMKCAKEYSHLIR